jgi:hypothetical protein
MATNQRRGGMDVGFQTGDTAAERYGRTASRPMSDDDRGGA